MNRNRPELGLMLMFAGIMTTSHLPAQIPNSSVRGNGQVSTQSRELTPFSQVKFLGSFDVILVPGSHPGAELSGEDNLFSYIRTEVRDQTLLISTQSGYHIHFTRPMTVRVSVGELENISLLGSGDLHGKGTISGNNMVVRLQGSGNISLNLNVRGILKTMVTGSGNLSLSGKASQASLSLTGSGNIDATRLRAGNWETNKVGSGNITK